MPSGDQGTPARRQQSSLYEILEVSPQATLDVIQAAYRTLARRYHPDVNPEPNAARLMRQLNAAYDVLSDPRRRAQYDAHCARSRRTRGGQRPIGVRRRDPSVAGPTASSVEPRPVHAMPRASARAAAHHPASSSGRALLAALIVALAAVLLVCIWIVLDGLDDRPSPSFRPRAGLPTFTVSRSSSFHRDGPSGDPLGRAIGLAAVARAGAAAPR